MLFSIIITFFSLLALIVLHELGHFLLAKKFGIEIEEFGVGYPPRILGKKIGKTVYSINLLPFGAFVKVRGEKGEISDSKSFSAKPIWQRFLIVLGGILIFLIVSWFLISASFKIGSPTAISDEEEALESKVQIVAVAKNSPAEKAGLKIGDFILAMESEGKKIEKIEKVKEVQEFTKLNLEKEIILKIERGKNIFETRIIPRKNPPPDEGPMGIVLVRTTTISLPFFKAVLEGLKTIFLFSFSILKSIPKFIFEILARRKLPAGVEIVGPVGIFSLSWQMINLGLNYYLRFLALISVYLAVFNILPIPALDGGKILFLAIEFFRKKPVPPKVEQNITAIFFAFLIFLMVLVTIRDILRLF
jgi:regulator of sigma E protease